jgi:hypothetical protein
MYWLQDFVADQSQVTKVGNTFSGVQRRRSLKPPRTVVSQVAVNDFVEELRDNETQISRDITAYTYIDNYKVCFADIARDFGVTVESRLKFATHINITL